MSLDGAVAASSSSNVPGVHALDGAGAEERAAKRPRLGDESSNTADTVAADQEELFRTAGPAVGQDGARQAAAVAQEHRNSDQRSFPRYDLRYRLAGHKKSVSSIKFSPNGRWMATACAYTSARQVRSTVGGSWLTPRSAFPGASPSRRLAYTPALVAFLQPASELPFAPERHQRRLVLCRFDPPRVRLGRQDRACVGDRPRVVDPTLRGAAAAVGSFRGSGRQAGRSGAGPARAPERRLLRRVESARGRGGVGRDGRDGADVGCPER